VDSVYIDCHVFLGKEKMKASRPAGAPNSLTYKTTVSKAGGISDTAHDLLSLTSSSTCRAWSLSSFLFSFYEEISKQGFH
jgi:hypothetical protein